MDQVALTQMSFSEHLEKLLFGVEIGVRFFYHNWDSYVGKMTQKSLQWKRTFLLSNITVGYRNGYGLCMIAYTWIGSFNSWIRVGLGLDQGRIKVGSRSVDSIAKNTYANKKRLEIEWKSTYLKKNVYIGYRGVCPIQG